MTREKNTPPPPHEEEKKDQRFICVAFERRNYNIHIHTYTQNAEEAGWGLRLISF